jgi:hypothetical protein
VALSGDADSLFGHRRVVLAVSWAIGRGLRSLGAVGLVAAKTLNLKDSPGNLPVGE